VADYLRRAEESKDRMDENPERGRIQEIHRSTKKVNELWKNISEAESETSRTGGQSITDTEAAYRRAAESFAAAMKHLQDLESRAADLKRRLSDCERQMKLVQTEKSSASEKAYLIQT